VIVCVCVCVFERERVCVCVCRACREDTPGTSLAPPPYRGTSLIRNSPPPLDPPGTLGIGLRQGPRRGVFLMSEAPLYTAPERRGSNLNRLKDFYLNAEARIWPRLSCMSNLASTVLYVASTI